MCGWLCLCVCVTEVRDVIQSGVCSAAALSVHAAISQRGTLFTDIVAVSCVTMIELQV